MDALLDGRVIFTIIKYPLAFMLISLILSMSLPGAALTYSASVNVFTHGTHKILSMNLSQDRISVVAYSTNYGKKCVIADRALTSAEKAGLDEFFIAIPLESLQDRYENKNVQGEIHRTFDICVRGRCRHIYNYFTEVPVLDDVVDRFYRIVPNMKNARCD